MEERQQQASVAEGAPGKGTLLRAELAGHMMSTAV
jgi:hypothetical protein